MKQIKISSKNQITIPRALMKVFHFAPGSRVIIEPSRNGMLIRSIKKSIAQDYYGYSKAVWRYLGGGEKHLEQERNSWEK